MFALDTNILLRYGLNDDLEQSAKAQEIIDSDVCFVPMLSLTEAGFSLRTYYGATAKDMVSFARSLLQITNLTFEISKERLAIALSGVEAGVDWYDAMLWASTPEHLELLTFDKKFINKAKRFGWLPQVVSAA